MNKYLAAFIAAGTMHGAPLLAQNGSPDFRQSEEMQGLSTTSPSPSPSPGEAPTAQVPPDQQPTVITAAKESTYNGAAKVAVLTGDVKVNNPQFTLSSDKLTIFFHKGDAGPARPVTKKTPAASPTPASTPTPAASGPAAAGSGNIDKVIAEGTVVINSERPDTPGGPPIHYSGKGRKVEYTPATGEMILYGLPQLQKGIDTLVATDDSTVIYLNRDGQMHADGKHKMTISDPGPDKTPTPRPSATTQPEMR